MALPNLANLRSCLLSKQLGLQSIFTLKASQIHVHYNPTGDLVLRKPEGCFQETIYTKVLPRYFLSFSRFSLSLFLLPFYKRNIRLSLRDFLILTLFFIPRNFFFFLLLALVSSQWPMDTVFSLERAPTTCDSPFCHRPRHAKGSPGRIFHIW